MSEQPKPKRTLRANAATFVPSGFPSFDPGPAAVPKSGQCAQSAAKPPATLSELQPASPSIPSQPSLTPVDARPPVRQTSMAAAEAPQDAPPDSWEDAAASAAPPVDPSAAPVAPPPAAPKPTPAPADTVAAGSSPATGGASGAAAAVDGPGSSSAGTGGTGPAAAPLEAGQVLPRRGYQSKTKFPSPPDPRPHLNILFIGHVDAGKSTISGHILWLTQRVDERTMKQFETEAREKNRESWKYAWAMDLTEEEREKGKTHEVGSAYFETEKRRFTILDAPGHKAFVPEMIGGAGQADVALLVISARRGEFETGFEKGGQTREHAVLVKTAGVRQLIVCVNKMDDPTVEWSKERYDQILAKLKPFLKSCGWADVMRFVPIAGLSGVNLSTRIPSDLCSWYDGPCLFEMLDETTMPAREVSAPLRFPVQGKFKDLGVVMLYGKVEAGCIERGDDVLLLPSNRVAEVAGVQIDGEDVDACFPGDLAHLKMKGIEEEDIRQGNVICEPARPLRVVTTFAATIRILEVKNVIVTGYSCVMHIHSIEEEVEFARMVAIIDRSDQVVERNPVTVRAGQKVLVRLATRVPVCVDTSDVFDRMARFVLRDEQRTIAVGVVSRLLHAPKE